MDLKLRSASDDYLKLRKQLLEADSKIHHFYTGQASLGDDLHRGIDLYSPVWNLFDLLPEGRGDWYPSHDYM